MKYFALLLLTFSFVFSTYAQIEESAVSPIPQADEDRYRNLDNSVGFGIVGGGELMGGMYPMPGLGYKRYTKEGAFRNARWDHKHQYAKWTVGVLQLR